MESSVFSVPPFLIFPLGRFGLSDRLLFSVRVCISFPVSFVKNKTAALRCLKSSQMPCRKGALRGFCIEICIKIC